MRIGILAEKIGMSRFYDEKSINQPVTLLKVANSRVVSIQSEDKNGYKSITVSHGLSKNQNKAFKEFTKKNKLTPFVKSKEFKVDSTENFNIGDEVGVKNFIVGQFIDVSANSIGKGFAGGMKRHNFSGNRATHGVSISHRSHGSTGQCQDPGKVFKGKKMAGRLGNKKSTVQNLQILKIDLENNLLIVKGAVPGHKGSVVKVIDSVKKKQDIKISSENLNNTNEPQQVTNNISEEQKETSNIEPQEETKNKLTESDSSVVEKKNDENVSEKNSSQEESNAKDNSTETKDEISSSKDSDKPESDKK